MSSEIEKLKRLNKQITDQRIRFCQENERLRKALDEYANPEWFVECFNPPIDKMPLHVMRRYFSKAKEALASK